MIAHQHMEGSEARQAADRIFDRLRRIGAAIDQVAEQDDMIVGLRPRADIVAHMGQQRQQQIEPAMDVADGIDTLSGRDLRSGRVSAPLRQRVHPLPPAPIGSLICSRLVQNIVSERINMALPCRIGNASRRSAMGKVRAAG
jgi:hypothetical protein